jgi:hypothetical protein
VAKLSLKIILINILYILPFVVYAQPLIPENDPKDSSFFDGPYIFWKSPNQAISKYFIYNAFEDKLFIQTKKHKIKSDYQKIKGIKRDSNTYIVSQNGYQPQDTEFENIDNIAVVGDVHGEYECLYDLLKGNKIVDKFGDWIYGKGQLVFIGDIFDRGDKVLESLYLIKRLESQAKKAGGRVHYLLGNHEVMILLGDTRYIHKKYKDMTNRTMLHYSKLFGENTELGRWIRSLNTIVKINNHLFVHAGLSKRFIDKKYSISEINNTTRGYLKKQDSVNVNKNYKEAYSKLNPIWYRGYLMRSKGSSVISSDELDSILDNFNADKIIFGHTEINKIRYLHNKRTIAINVPMGSAETKAEILLIEKDKFYKTDIKGNKELLK